MCIALIAANIFTAVWLFQSVNVNVLSAITGVRESLITAFELALRKVSLLYACERVFLSSQHAQSSFYTQADCR